jgi:hypothetical protein
MMWKALLSAAVVAASVATAAHANDVCKGKMYLAGGDLDSNGVVAFANPKNVVYIAQWSKFSITSQSSDLDRVDVQVDLMWQSIGTFGKANVWVAGWPPQHLDAASSTDATFANGSGNFQGINEPAGSQISLDANPNIAPYGLAYLTYSQQSQAPANVRWSAMSNGEGRIRMSFWYLTNHTALMNWIAVQPSSLLVCGL